MSWVIGLIVISYTLIFFEALVPGGILGLLGFTCLVAASVMAHGEFGGWFAPTATFLAGGLGAVILVFIELKWLEGNRFGSNLFLGRQVDGSSNAPVAPDDVIGKKGLAATPFKPEGIIRIEKEQFDAFCEDGYVSKGTSLVVSGKDGFNLRVRKT